MHNALRAGQFNDTMAADPYDAANDNIAQQQAGKTTYMQANAILGWLVTEGHISTDERDAGEHMIKLASIARSPLKSTTVRYSVRDAEGKWRPIEAQRHTIRPQLDKCIAAIKYEPRRKATAQALVVEETNIDLTNPHRVAQGLGDVAVHLWGKPRAVTPIITAENDNVEDDSAPLPRVRLLNGFDRMHSSKQLDDDADTNDALHAAGLRYAQDHHLARLNPLGAVDYSRVVVDGGAAGSGTESMVQARRRYRAAQELLGAKYAAVVEAVVVEGKSLGEIGASITRYRDRGKAIAAAGERLNAGLRLLAINYGILRS